MKNAIAFLALFLVLFPACSTSSEGSEVTIVYAGAATGKELDLTVAALGRFMKQNPGIRVHVRPTPIDYGERLDLYNNLLSEQSPDVDVFQIDVVWTRAMAPHAYDLAASFEAEEISKHFDIIVQNNTVDGKLVGMPSYTDAPFLFYRTDLLEKYGIDAPPRTWDELESAATRIQDGERQEGNLGFWGYVWQGKGAEGLTCNALEWQSSQGGGNFIDEEGRPSLTNPETVAAFKRAASWVGTISPPQVVEWAEDDSRIPWLKGDAAFMRNWPSDYAVSKESAIGDKFDVTTMPEGPGGMAAVLGGWQLMVSRYSENTEAAVKLVRFLTSEQEQKIRAVQGSFNPTIKSLYQDPDILKASGIFNSLNTVLTSVIRRPSNMAGENYEKASEAYWTCVHKILTGEDAQQALAEGEAQVSEALTD